jgi:hypothetical protein
MLTLRSVAVPDVSDEVSTVMGDACGGTVASSCAVQTNTSRHNKYTSAPFFMEFNGSKSRTSLLTITVPECGKRLKR